MYSVQVPDSALAAPLASLSIVVSASDHDREVVITGPPNSAPTFILGTDPVEGIGFTAASQARTLLPRGHSIWAGVTPAAVLGVITAPATRRQRYVV